MLSLWHLFRENLIPDNREDMETGANGTSPLTSLPPELVHTILSSLSDVDLANISLTCSYLAELARDDTLWKRIIKSRLPTQISSLPPPYSSGNGESTGCSSYKELYTALHPFWFLPQRRIWFSDTPMYGKLILTRYDPRRGAIEGYSLVAERGTLHMGVMRLDEERLAEYCSFHPKVQLDLNQPVVDLRVQDVVESRKKTTGVPQEVSMSSAGSYRPSSTLLLSTVLPKASIFPGTQVWPPLSMPAHLEKRTRNSSHNSFRSSGLRPNTPGEVCDSTFRIRQWAEFGPMFPAVIGRYMAGGRIGEHVTTYGTLCDISYTPTKEKPWQGIWCGDYSAHGCEFILVTQPDDPVPLPDHARKAARDWPKLDDNMPWSQTPAGDAGSHRQVDEQESAESTEEGVLGFEIPRPKDIAPYKGRLEAVKLTGDPNVPRGEYSFIADLGASVGFANDPIFDQHAGPLAGRKLNESETKFLPKDSKGSRIVKSIGHIATRGFSTDSYIPTRLVLVSEDTLAQYWEPFGHISFYRRVDIDKFLAL